MDNKTHTLVIETADGEMWEREYPSFGAAKGEANKIRSYGLAMNSDMLKGNGKRAGLIHRFYSIYNIVSISILIEE